jgi:hypothetical protein
MDRSLNDSLTPGQPPVPVVRWCPPGYLSATGFQEPAYGRRWLVLILFVSLSLGVRWDERGWLELLLRIIVRLQPTPATLAGDGGSWPVRREIRTASKTAETGLWPRCFRVRKSLIGSVSRFGPTTPTRPSSLPLIPRRLDRLSCCRALFAAERFSPSARERLPLRQENRGKYRTQQVLKYET